MKKQILMGALALSSAALLGLVGCGDKKDNKKQPELPKYTVTFDHDNNPETDNIIVEYTKGDKNLKGYNYVKALNKEVDGYAVVWDDYTLNDEDIVVNARYGDGSEQNPYLVSTGEQFAQILKDYSAKSTEFIRGNGTACDESEALGKIEEYKAVKFVYSRAAVTDEWGSPSMEIKNSGKKYYKLISSISLSGNGAESVVNNVGLADLQKVYFNGVIDGAKDQQSNYTISGLDGTMFKSTEGALFNNLVGATFKNLVVRLGDNIGSLAGIARGGNNVFENIKVYSTNQPTFVSADDNNESPFIVHALGDTTRLYFENCENRANINSVAEYHGLFLGGYAKDIELLSFTNCVNYGTITSVGGVGMLTGNGHYNPKEISVTGCKNEGEFITQKASHILVSNMTGSGLINTNVATYDVVGNGYSVETFKTLQAEYRGGTDGTNIVITNSEIGENVEAGNYQVVLSAFAINDQNRTIKLNIIVNKSITADAETITFEEIYYGFIDLNTYNANSQTQITVDDTWQTLTGYSNIKYKLTDNKYVFDFTQYEIDNAITNHKMSINTETTQLTKSGLAFITNQSGKVEAIKLVASFN